MFCFLIGMESSRQWTAYICVLKRRVGGKVRNETFFDRKSACRRFYLLYVPLLEISS